MVVLGSAISDGNLHLHDNLPVVLLDGSGKIKGGRHIRYPQGTPLANLYLNVLDAVGVRMDSLGDSTGKLDRLSV
jgi:hypothetical protein